MRSAPVSEPCEGPVFDERRARAKEAKMLLLSSPGRLFVIDSRSASDRGRDYSRIIITARKHERFSTYPHPFMPICSGGARQGKCGPHAWCGNPRKRAKPAGILGKSTGGTSRVWSPGRASNHTNGTLDLCFALSEFF